MSTKSTRRSSARSIIRSNARRVAPRIRSTGACSYFCSPRSGLSRWISAACRNVIAMVVHSTQGRNAGSSCDAGGRSIKKSFESPGGVGLGLARDRPDDQGRGSLGGLDECQSALGAEDVDRRVEASAVAPSRATTVTLARSTTPSPVWGSTMCE